MTTVAVLEFVTSHTVIAVTAKSSLLVLVMLAHFPAHCIRGGPTKATCSCARQQSNLVGENLGQGGEVELKPLFAL